MEFASTSSPVSPSAPPASSLFGSVYRAGKFCVVHAAEIGFVGTVQGYLNYLCVKGSDSLARPGSYILNSAIAAGFTKGIHLTYWVALKILGDREKVIDPSHPVAAKRLRGHAWKVISTGEEALHAIDRLFSRVLGMRPIATIEKEKIAARDLSIKELFRRAVIEQIPETIVEGISFEAALLVVGAAGFVIFGGHTLILINVVAGLALGVFIKYWLIEGEIRNEIEKEQMAAEAAKT